MENDTSLSKNEKMQYLFDKFKKSEEITPDDLKHLKDFVKEGKKKNQNREIILKEEKLVCLMHTLQIERIWTFQME